MEFIRVRTDSNKCMDCNVCRQINICYSERTCVGCLSCYRACPYYARIIYKVKQEPKLVKIYVNNIPYYVPEGLTVKQALETIGFKYSEPGSKYISAPCGTEGCWTCAMIINGSFERTCIIPLKENMEILTDIENIKLLRIVHGPQPHVVGGKATPWWEVNYTSYIEAAIWTAGCNLKCPQCQNYHVTYDNISKPLTSAEAAKKVALCHMTYGTKGIAISGGEPT